MELTYQAVITNKNKQNSIILTLFILDEKIQIFVGFECLLVFILMSVHNIASVHLISVQIRSDKVVYCLCMNSTIKRLHVICTKSQKRYVFITCTIRLPVCTQQE